MAKSNKRDDILRAALSLIVLHDLEHTSMEMIAREAHTGMGAIYNYFPGKDTLVNELYHESVAKLLAATSKDHTYDSPLREQFFSVLRSKFYFYLENPDIAQFLEQYAYSPVINDEVQAAAWQAWDVPYQIMEQGRKQQVLKDLPTEMLILLSSSPIFGLVKQHQNGHLHLDHNLIETAITACWDAIKR